MNKYGIFTPIPAKMTIEPGQEGYIKRLESAFKNANFERDGLPVLYDNNFERCNTIIYPLTYSPYLNKCSCTRLCLNQAMWKYCVQNAILEASISSLLDLKVHSGIFRSLLKANAPKFHQPNSCTGGSSRTFSGTI